MKNVGLAIFVKIIAENRLLHSLSFIIVIIIMIVIMRLARAIGI